MTTLPDAPRADLPLAAADERRPFRDNPRLILLGILLLLAALVALVTLADRTSELNPDFVSEVVLYAVSAADLTMLVVLVFVLARNIVKLLVERRRGLPFSRFRAKLVLAMLGLTIVPSVLVLIVGGELIRSSTERWLRVPVEDVLKLATQLASDYYGERAAQAETAAGRIAAALPAPLLAAGDAAAVQRAIEREVRGGQAEVVEVYQVARDAAGQATVRRMAEAASGVPTGSRAAAEQMARRIATGDPDPQVYEPLSGGSELVRAGSPVVDGSGATVGVVIAGAHLSGELATHARRINDAYEKYNELRVLRRPLQGIYLSLFLTMTLLILVSATWTGVYLAKRITRPVQRLAAGAREIGAGHLDHRIEPETRDEFGSLVEAFNSMASGLAASQQKIDRSRAALEQTNRELDERRRYIETVLERIATGVVSLAPDGRVQTINTAAQRLLDVDATVVGAPAERLFGRADLQPLRALLRPADRRTPATGQEFALLREGRELHLAAASTPLLRQDGTPEGAVLVFDDVTPLIRTQRVAAWRDVARRLAHEIKNPLTPIRLCAERMRRHAGAAGAPARAIVEECTDTIVGEVESLKELVDEFAQFARMPAPRQAPADLNAVLRDAVALYGGILREIRLDCRFAEGLPLVRVDAEQIRRVFINLVDNAVEALGGAAAGPRPNGESPVIAIETLHDPVNGVARVLVSDNGPGIPPADRDKLFMPYYSTKRRGSGLGLAIVRRIVAEHGGAIDVTPREPAGTVFTIELPLWGGAA